MILFNVAGIRHYEQNGGLKVGDTVQLVKEYSNAYDYEAIIVVKNGLKMGYVSNSPNTTLIGCHSAGRLVDLIENKDSAEIILTSPKDSPYFDNVVIARLDY